MRWTVYGERAIYDSEWVRLTLVDVEIPGGDRFDHHVVRSPLPAAGAVVVDPSLGVLLMWRHRFITDTWGWEIPAGRMDAGETPLQAAARETLEETGWAPGPLSPLISYHPQIGLSDQAYHVFSAAGASEMGPPADPGESSRIEWVSFADTRSLALAGEVRDGMSLVGLLHAMATGLIPAL